MAGSTNRFSITGNNFFGLFCNAKHFVTMDIGQYVLNNSIILNIYIFIYPF